MRHILQAGLFLCAWLLVLLAAGCDQQPDNLLSQPAPPPVSGAEQIESLTGGILSSKAEESAGENPDEGGVSPAPAEQEIPAGQEPADENSENAEAETEMKLNVQIGGRTFQATLEENAAAEAFVEMLRENPAEIQMSDYSGFEKVGPLGTELPASDRQTTTQAGDIVLYTGNQIVIFYGSNSWSYTRLGKIDDLTGWTEALGNGDVTIRFSLAE